jgi:hypothetical protein
LTVESFSELQFNKQKNIFKGSQNYNCENSLVRIVIWKYETARITILKIRIVNKNERQPELKFKNQNCKCK